MEVQTTVTLSDREEAFVRNLANGMAPTRAATEAGWSVGHTAALLRKPTVVSALLAIHRNIETILDVIDAPEGDAA